MTVHDQNCMEIEKKAFQTVMSRYNTAPQLARDETFALMRGTLNGLVHREGLSYVVCTLYQTADANAPLCEPTGGYDLHLHLEEIRESRKPQRLRAAEKKPRRRGVYALGLTIVFIGAFAGFIAYTGI